MDMDHSIKHYLGVDYGEAKIGLALADSETRIAFSYGVIKNNQDFWEHLKEIVAKENVDTVVIGIPSHINRKETVYAGETLGERIRKEIGARVAYQDEMFSTKLARENLKEKGVHDINRFDDEEAARIILQEYLDTQAAGK